MSTLIALGATIVLLALNGFFVAAEFALVAARRDSIQERAEQGSRLARLALRDVEDLSPALAGAQLGITMASLGLGFVSEPALAHLIEVAIGSVIDISSGVAHAIAIPIALTIVVYLHMVIGEMAPKNIAIAQPESLTLALAIPFRAYMTVFKPIVLGLNAVANGVLRLLGVDPTVSTHQPATGEELSFLIETSRHEGYIADLEHRLLTGALAFSERDIAEVMVPRNRVAAAPETATAAELEEVASRTGHSRIPVYAEDLDGIRGFIHVKDLLRVDPDAHDLPVPQDLIRPLPVVPESARLDPVMLEMRRSRSHIALVIDEHGGTAGIVTLEDLVEELVGDFADEHDRAAVRVVRLGPNHFRLPGMLRLDEIEHAVGIRLPEGEYDTLGGYVMAELGRLPEPGDRVEHDEWVLEVRSLDGRRVDVVEAIHLPEEPATDN